MARLAALAVLPFARFQGPRTKCTYSALTRYSAVSCEGRLDFALRKGEPSLNLRPGHAEWRPNPFASPVHSMPMRPDFHG